MFIITSERKEEILVHLKSSSMIGSLEGHFGQQQATSSPRVLVMESLDSHIESTTVDLK